MHRLFPTAALVALVAFNGANTPVTCSAESIFSPAGLNPGDEYRLVFTTAGKRDATSTEIADYNAFVTAEAHAPMSLVAGLSTGWSAIVSTPSVDAIDNTGTDPSPPGATGVPIFLVDGSTRVAANYDDLWDGSIENTIHQAQIEGVGVEAVWTGTGANGTQLNPLGVGDPGYGLVTTLDGGWAHWGSGIPADTALPVYALSGVLTAVPEPTSGMLLGLGVLGMLFSPGRRIE